RHDPRDYVLDDEPEDPARHDDREEDEEGERERAAHAEARVEEDERIGEEPEPDVSLEPRRRSPELPRAELAPHSEEAGEEHEDRARDPVGEAGERAATRADRRPPEVVAGRPAWRLSPRP